MKKPVIRVTQLEQYRRFVSDRYEYMTEQDVIDSATGSFAGNVKTRVGTALHNLVEHASDISSNLHFDVPSGSRQYLYYGKLVSEDVSVGLSCDVDGHKVVFSPSQTATIMEYAKLHPHAFHEFRSRKDYGPAIVTGCADLIDGTVIHDIKTKFSTPDDSDFTDSVQWRFYCDIFEADCFVYDIFEFVDYNEDRHGHDVRGLLLHRREPVTCYPYPSMQHELTSLVNDYVDWCRRRGILDKINI